MPVGYPSAGNFTRFNFGIDIAEALCLAEERVRPVNRAKAEKLIQEILPIERFPITNGEHEILIDHFDLHFYAYWRLQQ